MPVLQLTAKLRCSLEKALALKIRHTAVKDLLTFNRGTSTVLHRATSVQNPTGEDKKNDFFVSVLQYIHQTS